MLIKLSNHKEVAFAKENYKEILHSSFHTWRDVKKNFENDQYSTVYRLDNIMSLKVGFVLPDSKEWHTLKFSDFANQHEKK